MHRAEMLSGHREDVWGEGVGRRGGLQCANVANSQEGRVLTLQI